MKAPEEVEEKEDLETNSDGFSIFVVEDNEELKACLLYTSEQPCPVGFPKGGEYMYR